MQAIWIHFSVAAAGFSVITLVLLFFQNRPEQKSTKIISGLLLCVLIVIQLLQASYLLQFLDLSGMSAVIYLFCLGSVGPLFYLYSRHIIYTEKHWRRIETLHFLPVLAISCYVFVFPDYFYISYSLLFLLGGIYMLFLVWSLFQLRERRNLFKIEFFFAAGFLCWAFAVALVGILGTQRLDALVPAQIIMLAAAIAGALHIQLNYPHLLSSLEEIASRQYQTSTLLNVDCDAAKKHLRDAMTIDRIYQDSELSLSSMAEVLSLKPHQLSELLNTQLGMGFAAYLRQQRVKAAEELLKSEPETSVLAIGLTVGFSSQSAFYSAFKEIHSIAPGQYRRL